MNGPRSEQPTGGEAPDPDDADVPDFAGELEHSRTRGTDAAADPGVHERASPMAVVILASIALVIGAAALWAALTRGPKSVAPPTPTLSPTEVAAVDAPQLFAQNCAGCHGAGGAGASTFPAAPVLAGRGLPAQSIARVVHDGAPGMAAFAGRLTSEEIAALAVYVAALAPPPSSPSG